MGMDVDEAGGHQQAPRVDLLAPRGEVLADRGDPPGSNRHIGHEGRRAGTVDHGAAAQDSVELGAHSAASALAPSS